MTVRRSSSHIRNLIDYRWSPSSHEISQNFQESSLFTSFMLIAKSLIHILAQEKSVLSKSCLPHHRSTLLFKTQDHSLVPLPVYAPLPGDNNSDPFEVRTMKIISQVLKRHYIAYIHSCLADLCLIFCRSSSQGLLLLDWEKRKSHLLVSYSNYSLFMHLCVCVCEVFLSQR